MPISFEVTDIEEVRIITPHIFEDGRGRYIKLYERNIYTDFGISCIFSESSEIISPKGVLRGLHFQTVDSQAKLVHVVHGTVYDVAVDLRPDSKTFGRWKSFQLTGEKDEAVFIPEGFAHGFLVLESDTIFTYQCSGIYRPEYCGGIMWNDPALSIDWPLSGIDKVILSEKDKHNLSMEEYKKRYIGAK